LLNSRDGRGGSSGRAGQEGASDQRGDCPFHSSTGHSVSPARRSEVRGCVRH
jgi:hypothetical protein